MEEEYCKKDTRNDEYMVFDEVKRRYILTAKALTDKTGINLATRLNAKGSANVQATINGFLDRISALTYRFICQYNDTEFLINLIACSPSARPIIMEAMLSQALYVLIKGDLSLSSNKDERELWFDQTAKSVLETPLQETGVCLLYSGSYGRW